MANITKSFLNDLDRNPAKRSFHWDDKTKGFGVVVQPSGAASYVFQYRTGTKTHRTTLSPLGNLTPTEARKMAQEYAYKVAKGLDPAAEKRARKSAYTVGDMLKEYKQSYRFNENSPKTQETDSGRINRHLIPLLGKKALDKLTERDIKTAIKQIAEGKTAVEQKTKARGLARVTGGEGVANKCLALLKAAFSWAESDGLTQHNPSRAIKVAASKKRTYALDSDGYKRVFEAMDELTTGGSLHPHVADAIRLIALTGCRRGEIVNLKWENVTLKQGRLEISEHKTKRRTGENIIVGLDTYAQEIIARQPAGDAGDYVFSITEGKPVSLNKPLSKIREKASLPSEFCLHTFRHSLATSAAESGASVHEIQALLGHKTLAMASHYVHLAEDKRAAIGRKAAGPIAAIMSKQDSSNMVRSQINGGDLNGE